MATFSYTNRHVSDRRSSWEFFTLRAVPPTQFIFNRVPFCDGFTPRLADRRGLAPSALEPIFDPETISEAVWIADAVLVFEAAILANYMGIEALQTLQLFISQDVRANSSCDLGSYPIEPTARDIPQQTPAQPSNRSLANPTVVHFAKRHIENKHSP